MKCRIQNAVASAVCDMRHGSALPSHSGSRGEFFKFVSVHALIGSLYTQIHQSLFHRRTFATLKDRKLHQKKKNTKSVANENETLFVCDIVRFICICKHSKLLFQIPNNFKNDLFGHLIVFVRCM